jgi:hypothetical protein
MHRIEQGRRCWEHVVTEFLFVLSIIFTERWYKAGDPTLVEIVFSSLLGHYPKEIIWQYFTLFPFILLSSLITSEVLSSTLVDSLSNLGIYHKTLLRLPGIPRTCHLCLYLPVSLAQLALLPYPTVFSLVNSLRLMMPTQSVQSV